MQQYQSRMQDKLFQNKSQSILEVLLSLIIFSIAFVSLIILVNNYLKILKTTKERIIANFLAQEGLELVIAKRNINKAAGKGWLDGLSGSNCIDINLDPKPGSSTSCPLYLNDKNQYVHTNTATQTIFSRLIKIEVNNNIATVTSIVDFGDSPPIELETILTDWIPTIP